MAAEAPTAAQPEVAQPAEELPDWLKGLAAEAPTAAQPEAARPAEAPSAGWEALGALGTSSKEQDEALAWLESLAARHGAKPEELVTPPETRQEKPPAWVEAARQRLEAAPTAETPAQPAEELPDWLKGMAAEAPTAAQPEAAQPAEAPSAGWEALGALGTSSKEQDEALAWLESLAARHGAKPEELVTPPETRQEKPPAWVEAARQRLEAAPTAETPAQPAEELPDWLKGLAAEAPTAAQPEAAQPAEELPDWLKGLAAEAPTAAQPEAAQPAEELPDWLKGLAAEAPTAAQPEAAQPAEELPDWLKGAVAEAPTAAQPEAAQPSEELPDWLKGMATEAPTAAQPEAARPAEELPDWLKGMTAEAPAAAQPEAARPAEAPSAGWEALGALGTSSKEQDEALAWLESLAARHGAKPEELVTPPETRQEKPPAWVEAARQRLEAAPAAETPAQPAEELPGLAEGDGC
jgi:hypothetical protein